MDAFVLGTKSADLFVSQIRDKGPADPRPSPKKPHVPTAIIRVTSATVTDGMQDCEVIYIDPSDLSVTVVKTDIKVRELNAASLADGFIGVARFNGFETGGAALYVLHASGSGEFQWWKVMSFAPSVRPPTAAPNTPRIYTLRRIELVADASGSSGNQLGWQEVTPTVEVTTGIRAPSSVHDESYLTDLLIDIKPGQAVLARPSPTLEGYYEMTPWGSVTRTVERRVHLICWDCVDSGGGVYVPLVKIAFKKVLTVARDRRTFWMPPGTGESGLDDNTAGQFDPPNDLGPDT